MPARCALLLILLLIAGCARIGPDGASGATPMNNPSAPPRPVESQDRTAPWVPHTEGLPAQKSTAAVEASAQAGSMQSTATAQPMRSLVEALYADGLLSRTEGEFIAMDPVEVSWAQRDHYDVMPTGTMLRDFVLSAKLAWSSASENADPAHSGCGFAFRMNTRGDHYLAYLGLDGWHYLFRNVNGSITSISRGFAGPLNLLEGSADISLVVEGEWISALVDGELVDRAQDDSFAAGLLAYAIVSGTNTDFGIRCELSEVEVWSLVSE